MKKQPAEKSYVFDKGYRDVANVFADTWGKTFDGNSMRKLFSNFFMFIPNLIAFIIITVFKVVLNSIISILLIAAFLIVAPVVYIGFVFIAFLDFVYRLIKRISSMCPRCQYKYDLPAYICPNCKRVHTRLIPSQYGIFKRKCICGKKLSTTFFNGRQKYQAICTNCNLPLPNGGKVASMCITVVGGPSAGKTCYVAQTLSKMSKDPAILREYDYAYYNNGMNEYEDIARDMEAGQLPQKTNDDRLQYYEFYLTPKKAKVKRLISLCDVAGEVYKDIDLLGGQIGFRHADGFIILIDPLSVEDYRKEIGKKIRLSQYGVSYLSIDEVLSRLVSTLENLYSISSNKVLKPDVAVVFTKADIPGFDEMMGHTAVKEYMKTHDVTEEEAQNELCKSFLQKYDESNFLNNLNSKFKTVQFFTCSALGTPGSGKFQSSDVEKPIMWLIKRKYKK